MSREQVLDPNVVFTINGKQERYPTLIKSGNGYYMKPDEARTQWQIDRNKERSWGTLGAGFNGMYEWIREWLLGRLEDVESVQWKDLDKGQQFFYMENNAPAIYWTDRVFGPMSMEVDIGHYGTYVTLKVGAPYLLPAFADKQASDDDANDYWSDMLRTVGYGGISDYARISPVPFGDQSKSDYWKNSGDDRYDRNKWESRAMTDFFDDRETLLDHLMPYVPDRLHWIFRDLPAEPELNLINRYQMRREDDYAGWDNQLVCDPEVYAKHSHNIAEAMPKESLEALEKMAAILRKFGSVELESSNGVPIALAVTTEEVRNADKEITRHGHGIRLDLQTGKIRVRCGYEKDDKKYVEWQRREAAHLMRQLDDDFEDESETKTEYQEIDIFDL